MRFSNTDLAPTLAIVGGGVFGVLIFGSFLFLWSPSNDVPAASDATELAAPAQAAAQEVSPEHLEAIQAGPVFTPMTVRPEIRNRDEIMATLIRNFPSDLRDAGIGGQVVVWFYIGDTGNVLHTRISQSSGHDGLDAAALRVANVYEFTPALNRDQRVAVWIQIPITFQVR